MQQVVSTYLRSYLSTYGSTNQVTEVAGICEYSASTKDRFLLPFFPLHFSTYVSNMLVYSKKLAL